jgi:hypothetical protein
MTDQTTQKRQDEQDAPGSAALRVARERQAIIDGWSKGVKAALIDNERNAGDGRASSELRLTDRQISSWEPRYGC